MFSHGWKAVVGSDAHHLDRGLAGVAVGEVWIFRRREGDVGQRQRCLGVGQVSGEVAVLVGAVIDPQIGAAETELLIGAIETHIEADV